MAGLPYLAADQTRPNIHIQISRMCSSIFSIRQEGDRNIQRRLREHFHPRDRQDGREICSRRDRRQRVKRSPFLPAQRDKLLGTGFKPKFKVIDAIREIIERNNTGKLTDEDGCYNSEP